MGYIGNGPYQGVLTGGNIQDGTVETTDLADGAITTVKINDGAVTAAKLASGAAVPDQSGQSGKYLTTDGSTASWGTVTTPTLASLGIDNHDDITVDSSGQVGIGTGTPTSRLEVQHTQTAMIRATQTGADGWDAILSLKNTHTGGKDWRLLSTNDSRGTIGGGKFVIQNYDAGSNIQYLTIDSSGRVTMPYQPMFMAYSGAYRSGGNQETLQFTSALSNVGNHYNTSTYTFTAPVSGHYRFSFSLMTYQAGHSRICFAKNGANIANQFYAQTYQSSTEYARNCGEIIVYLAANDTMRVHRNVQNEGSEVVHVDYRHFSGQLVG